MNECGCAGIECLTKKHPCPDCRQCQFCSESRCNVCRGQKTRPPKLSISEQIALYEKINAEEEKDSLIYGL